MWSRRDSDRPYPRKNSKTRTDHGGFSSLTVPRGHWRRPQRLVAAGSDSNPLDQWISGAYRRPKRALVATEFSGRCLLPLGGGGPKKPPPFWGFGVGKKKVIPPLSRTSPSHSSDGNMREAAHSDYQTPWQMITRKILREFGDGILQKPLAVWGTIAHHMLSALIVWPIIKRFQDRSRRF